MKERPILMTPENAQKVFDGTKTQTRRILKSQPWEGMGRIDGPAFYAPTKVNKRTGEECPGDDVFGVYDHTGEWSCVCPFGRPGDRLWIRENGWERPERTPKMLRDGADTWERFYFDALLDDGEAAELKGYGFKRRPSIYMPRWASRTVVELTEVRVERLQEITEADALAEGCGTTLPLGPTYEGWADTVHRELFKQLWESINGNGSWALNPYVWVLRFKKVTS